MLAPRKKLWSTPSSAVKFCLEFIPLKPKDCVLDIGCGDGRILLQWAEMISSSPSEGDTEYVSTVSFLGIDIDPARVEECRRAANLAKSEGRILSAMRVDFVCCNALESVELFQHATVIFLYLIPRGLRQIYPLLLEHCRRMEGKTLRIATYMSKLPNEKPVERALCPVDHQQDAAWPLYFYELRHSRP